LSMYLNASFWVEIFSSSFLSLHIDCDPRVYFNWGGGAVRPSICVSASSSGSWPWDAMYTEIFTELDPALTERMILGILTAAHLPESLKLSGKFLGRGFYLR